MFVLKFINIYFKIKHLTLELEILFCYNCINVNDNVVIFRMNCEDLVEASCFPLPKVRDSFFYKQNVPLDFKKLR